MPYYSMEFILHTGESESHSTVRNYLGEWARDLDITECSQDECAPGKDFKICMHAQDPTIIFDLCAQFGRIKSVKIDEG
jgi:dihydroxyacetone kinase-like predicted kinase